MHQLSLQNIEAAIFDMDGTMINNMAFHKKAWYEFCRRHNLEMTEDQFKQKISGKKNNQIFELLFNKQLTIEEIAQFTEEKEAVYREVYAPEIKPVNGLNEFLNKLVKKNIKLAIATTAPAKNRQFVLNELQLTGKFPIILGDEDASKGKPDPEIYLKTAERLQVDPAKCVAFEDSPPGVQSAHSAGMLVVGILTTHSEDELKQSGASIVVADFSELQL